MRDDELILFLAGAQCRWGTRVCAHRCKLDGVDKPGVTFRTGTPALPETFAPTPTRGGLRRLRSRPASVSRSDRRDPELPQALGHHPLRSDFGRPYRPPRFP